MYAGQCLELDAVRFAPLEKTDKYEIEKPPRIGRLTFLNLEIPQSQAASNTAQ